MRHFVLLALGFAALTAPRFALADDPSAAELLRQGVQLRREHRNEEALELFERAVAASPTAIGRAQIALAEQALGRWVEAERDLDAALNLAAGDEWIAKNRPALEEARSQMGRHLAWLTVLVDVAAAQVHIDGRSIAMGTDQRIASGPAVLAVTASGYVPDIRHIEVVPSVHARVEVTMVPLVAQAQPPERPGAMPSALLFPMTASSDERPRSPSFPAGPAVLAAAGLTGIGVGTYFGVRAFDQKRQRDAGCGGGTCDPTAFPHDADARSSSLASTVAIGAGAGAIAAGAAWWILDAGRAAGTSSRRGSFAPLVLGALGIAGAGAGAYLALLSVSDRHSRDALCPGGSCAASAQSFDAEARTAADLSVVAFGASAVLVGTATGIWIADPARGRGARAASPAPQLAVGPAGVMLRGAIP